MTFAFLETWPDEPRLDSTYDPLRFGQMNALAYMALGLNHAKGHLPQIQETSCGRWRQGPECRSNLRLSGGGLTPRSASPSAGCRLATRL